jgi:hypothetical protein
MLNVNLLVAVTSRFGLCRADGFLSFLRKAVDVPLNSPLLTEFNVPSSKL